MTFGKVGDIEVPLVIVGGNCAIQGFGHLGTEQFWTTTGGNVTCLVLIDVEEDGKNELLVGSDDYTIYIYQEEEVLNELQETHEVTGLCRMINTTYGFV